MKYHVIAIGLGCTKYSQMSNTAQSIEDARASRDKLNEICPDAKALIVNEFDVEKAIELNNKNL
jgi:hypothetical protein